MQHRSFECVLIAVLIAGVSGCNVLSHREAEKDASARQVPLSAVPAPARTTIEKLVAGGEIKKIEKEEVDGKTVYDVEARVGDKNVEYDVGDDGAVLTTEESVPYASAPTVVRAAAEKYFGSAVGLKASREVSNGKTFYEVEGKRKDHAVTLKLTDTGRIVEEEKE